MAKRTDEHTAEGNADAEIGNVSRATVALTEGTNASRAAVQELTKAYQELATKNVNNLPLSGLLSFPSGDLCFEPIFAQRPRCEHVGDIRGVFAHAVDEARLGVAQPGESDKKQAWIFRRAARLDGINATCRDRRAARPT